MEKGRKIVLAASDSESSEHEQKAWSQMLLATLPARYVRTFHVNWPRPNETAPDGQARYVPMACGLLSHCSCRNSRRKTSRSAIRIN